MTPAQVAHIHEINLYITFLICGLGIIGWAIFLSLEDWMDKRKANKRRNKRK